MVVKKVSPLEEEEHLAFMQWASLHPICKAHLIHIPNEGNRGAWGGRKMKMKGLKAGVSDFFLAYPTSSSSGLWIELKRTVLYRISPEQREWITLMKNAGYDADFAYGWEDAKNIVEQYLSNEEMCQKETKRVPKPVRITPSKRDILRNIT
jgi:hypothetical protein